PSEECGSALYDSHMNHCVNKTHWTASGARFTARRRSLHADTPLERPSQRGGLRAVNAIAQQPGRPSDRDRSENHPASPVYSSAGLGPAGDQPGWATGAALDLRGANEDRGPRRRNLAEIRHAFETPFVAAEQRLVGLEFLARPDVQRDGIDADAGDLALRDQELAGLLGEAREVVRVRLSVPR